MLKIGIDLATIKTGIVVLDENNELIYYHLLELESWKQNVLMSNCHKIFLTIKVLLDSISYLLQGERVVFGFEISNFKDAKLTCRFNFYFGAFVQAIQHLAREKHMEDKIFFDYEIRYFNATEWQKKITSKKLTRDEIKKCAYDFAKNNAIRDDFKSLEQSQDLIDAWNIAYWLKEIRTTEEAKEEVRARSKEKKTIKQLQNKGLKKINDRLIKLASLDKEKNKRQIERIKQEIEDIKKECKIWK